jgi:hypothetical protein
MVSDLVGCCAWEENPWMTNKHPRRNATKNTDFTFIPFTIPSFISMISVDKLGFSQPPFTSTKLYLYPICLLKTSSYDLIRKRGVTFLRGPGVRQRSLVAFLGSDHIEMEGGKVYQGRVYFSNRPQIDRLDVLVTLIAEVNAISFLPFGGEVMKRFLIFIVTERAKNPIGLPLIPTIGTDEKSFPHLLFQKA